jgi:hypothetical protein
LRLDVAEVAYYDLSLRKRLELQLKEISAKSDQKKNEVGTEISQSFSYLTGLSK